MGVRSPVTQHCGSALAAVVPGGMWGHLNAKLHAEGYPQFFRRAEGCHLWDVDGNEYIDLMCAYGPIVLGTATRSWKPPRASSWTRGDA